MLYLSSNSHGKGSLFNKFSDKQILEGIRRQDEKILNHLYTNYYNTVKNHVVQNSGTPDDVSDVLQESIIILYSQIISDDFELTSDLKGFFFGIVRNVWSAQIRKKSRSVELTFDISDEDTPDIAGNELLDRIVRRSFVKLKDDCQQMLNLHIDGKSYEEIARIMGMKNEVYARRKKYLCKEALMDIVRSDKEFQDLDL